LIVMGLAHKKMSIAINSVDVPANGG
jgi:hypothetical protein